MSTAQRLPPQIQTQPKMDEMWLPEATQIDGDPDRRRLGAGRQFRHLIREAQAESARSQRPAGHCFREIWRGVLGLRDHRSRDSHTGMVTKFERDKAKVRYEDLPLREVSEELFSSEFCDGLANPKIADSCTQQLRENMPVPSANQGQYSLRESLAPVTASVYQDINYWSIYVGGLAEAAFLEAYQSPRYIARDLVKWTPSNMRSQRIIQTARVPSPGHATVEGTEYEDVAPLPRWVVRPNMVKRGSRGSCTREAIAYGLGGTLMQSFGAGGDALAYIQEYLLAATIQGQNIPAGQQWFQNGFTANTYLYCQEPGTAYNATYQTAVGTGSSVMYNYVNKFTGSTGLQTYLQLQAARLALSQMREYETGFRIENELNQIKVAVGQKDTANNVLHSTSIAPVSPGFATSGTPVMTFSPNPPGNSNIQVLSSQIWDDVLTDAGVSASNLLDYWYAGDFREAFGWAELWPAALIPMDARSESMVSRDTVWGAVYSWCGVPYIREARKAIQYTN